MPKGAAAGRMLKEAFHDLIDEIRPLKVAASECRVGVTTLHRYASLDSEDGECHAAIDVVAAMERVAGNPVVTRKLCELSNGMFMPLPQIGARPADLLTLLAAQATESGELTAAICVAVSDGKVDTSEGAAITREIDHLIAVAAAMRATVQSLLRGDQ